MTSLTILAAATILALGYAAWTYRHMLHDAQRHARHLRRIADDLTRQRDEARAQRGDDDEAAILAALERHPAKALPVVTRHLASVVDR